MARLERIAVAGGTGMVGRRVAHQLVQAGYNVTLLTRHANRPSPVPGAQLALANLREPDAVRAALADHDGLFIALNIHPGELSYGFHAEEEGLVNLMRAAQQTHIQRLGLLVPMLKDYRRLRQWWAVRVKRKAITRIQLSGIPYGIFNSACIMETLPERHRLGHFLLVPRGCRGQSWWISADDLGRQVAAFFALPSASNQEIPVQGLEPFLFSEAAELWCQASHHNLRIVQMSVSALRLAGLLIPAAAQAAGLFQALRDYQETFQAQPTWDVLGRPTTTLAQFAQGGAASAPAALTTPVGA